MTNAYIDSTIIFLINFPTIILLGSWSLIYHREKYHVDGQRFDQFMSNLGFQLRLLRPVFTSLVSDVPPGRVEAKTANRSRYVWGVFCCIAPFALLYQSAYATPDGVRILSLISFLLQILAIGWMFRLGRNLGS